MRIGDAVMGDMKAFMAKLRVFGGKALTVTGNIFFVVCLYNSCSFRLAVRYAQTYVGQKRKGSVK